MTQKRLSSNFWVVRHAKVAVNGLCYGQSDVPLVTPHDKASRYVSDALKASNFAPDVIWTSDLERCLGLAEHLKRIYTEAELMSSEVLRELNFGVWEARTWDEIDANDHERFRAWTDHWEEASCPGGESLNDLNQRIWAWSEQLNLNKKVLYVGHAGPIRALRVKFEDRVWSDVMSERIEHLEPFAIKPT